METDSEFIPSQAEGDSDSSSEIDDANDDEVTVDEDSVQSREDLGVPFSLSTPQVQRKRVRFAESTPEDETPSNNDHVSYQVLQVPACRMLPTFNMVLDYNTYCVGYSDSCSGKFVSVERRFAWS